MALMSKGAVWQFCMPMDVLIANMAERLQLARYHMKSPVAIATRS